MHSSRVTRYDSEDQISVFMSSLTDSAVAAFQLITHQDPMLWSVVARSLWVSVWATAIAGVLGVCFGAWLAVVRFQARGALLILLNTLLALPSVVVGLVVYLLLSRSGPLGHLGWLFSLKAMVLAQSVLVFPVVAALTRQCIEDADRQHGEQLQSIGAGIGLRSLILVWDERYVFLTIVITAFGRAISEVGAVMVVGGNIEGFTRVMTTAIALETSKGDLPLALALGLVLLVVVLILNVLVGVIKSWRLRVDGATAQPLQKGWV
jgi:tungstate transport system permease protein